MQWTAYEVWVLLQIACMGRVTREARARLGATLAARDEALLLMLGRNLAYGITDYGWSVADLVHVLNRARADVCPAHPAEGRRPPLVGYLCEQCLDASAVALVPAPWGGEMGVCWTCQEPAEAS